MNCIQHPSISHWAVHYGGMSGIDTDYHALKEKAFDGGILLPFATLKRAQEYARTGKSTFSLHPRARKREERTPSYYTPQVFVVDGYMQANPDDPQKRTKPVVDIRGSTDPDDGENLLCVARVPPPYTKMRLNLYAMFTAIQVWREVYGDLPYARLTLSIRSWEAYRALTGIGSPSYWKHAESFVRTITRSLVMHPITVVFVPGAELALTNHKKNPLLKKRDDSRGQPVQVRPNYGTASAQEDGGEPDAVPRPSSEGHPPGVLQAVGHNAGAEGSSGRNAIQSPDDPSEGSPL